MSSCTPWIEPDELDLECLPAVWRDLNDDETWAKLSKLCELASSLLFHTTGARWPGCCRFVLRPSPPPVSCLAPGRLAPYGVSASMAYDGRALLLGLPWPIITAAGDGHEPLTAKVLANPDLGLPTPLVRIVAADGTKRSLLPYDDFDVRDDGALVLWSGSWPIQARGRAGLPGTWAIEVPAGEMPPLHVLVGCAKLVYALAARECGSGVCALPENVTSASIHGTVLSFEAGSTPSEDSLHWVSGFAGVDMLIGPHTDSTGDGRILPRGGVTVRYEAPGSPAWRGAFW